MFCSIEPTAQYYIAVVYKQPPHELLNCSFKILNLNSNCKFKSVYCVMKEKYLSSTSECQVPIFIEHLHYDTTQVANINSCTVSEVFGSWDIIHIGSYFGNVSIFAWIN